ncbi:MAG TPA: hypothetical protein VN815_18955 [Steroidobacteraceae bacterium]|nr:hypothetical protein [Steroidobacteraceae bacterium]
MLIVSCDPGVRGALAFLDHNDVLAVYDMPIRLKPGISKVSNEVDPIALQTLIRACIPAGESVIAVMEDMHSFMGSGEQRTGSMASQASLAATKATIRTVLELNRLRVQMVTPRVWQAVYGIRKRPDATTKQQSLKIARELYGAHYCPLAKHDGRADAVLIARWAQRHLT